MVSGTIIIIIITTDDIRSNVKHNNTTLQRLCNTSNSGINLKQVTVHELGHIFGLDHSTVKSAIMYPYYRGYLPNFALDPDDIAGIQALYG